MDSLETDFISMKVLGTHADHCHDGENPWPNRLATTVAVWRWTYAVSLGGSIRIDEAEQEIEYERSCTDDEEDLQVEMWEVVHKYCFETDEQVCWSSSPSYKRTININDEGSWETSQSHRLNPVLAR